MLVEGVFAGSLGPVLYREQNIKASVAAWNARPITIGHPEQNGTKVSGCTPEALETSSIGMVLNTKYNSKSKKLQAEAWFDVERLSAVKDADMVLQALTTNSQLEVSTGLFFETNKQAGDFQGTAYSMEAENFKPDHLAIILDGEGACAIKDGAGLLVNKAQAKKPEQPAVLVGNAKELLALTDKVRAAVYQTHEVYRDDAPSTYAYVEQIYASYVLFALSEDGKMSYFKQNYEVDGESVKLIGELIPVIKKVSYQVENKKATMERQDLISRIGSQHADFVTNMSEDQFKALDSAFAAKAAPAPSPVAPKVVSTVEELLVNASPALKNQVSDALASADAMRTELITEIVANSKDSFTAAELASFTTPHLTKLAKLAKAPVAPAAPAKAPVYAGEAFVGNQGSTSAVAETGFAPPSTF